MSLAASPRAANPEQERRLLQQTWAEPPGILGWLSAADHKTIGKRYLVTCFGFFIFAGLLAAAMRWQLATPENVASLGRSVHETSFGSETVCPSM